MTNSYKAGFLTGFLCALLGLLAVGGAWWVGSTLGEKNQKEKLERIQFEKWRDYQLDASGLRPGELYEADPEMEKVEVEMGTPMSVEEVSKRIDEINAKK